MSKRSKDFHLQMQFFVGKERVDQWTIFNTALKKILTRTGDYHVCDCGNIRQCIT